MAGLAAPLRASRPDDSEAKGLGSLINRPPTLLAHHAAAEAAGRGAGNGVRRKAARGGEDRAAEILFEPVGDIIPQLGHFGGRLALGIDRSEARRVGTECVSTCRSRWSTYREKKNVNINKP